MSFELISLKYFSSSGIFAYQNEIFLFMLENEICLDKTLTSMIVVRI